VTRPANTALVVLAAVAILSLAVPLSAGKDADGPANAGAFLFLVGVLPLAAILALAVWRATGGLRTAAIGVSYGLGVAIASLVVVAAVWNRIGI
jgi:hypothetical protein